MFFIIIFVVVGIKHDIYYFNELKNHLLVVHQNIRSVRKNFDLFTLKLSYLHNKPHIIILTEIWINDCEVALYSLPGFNVYSQCNISHRAGGVLVYVADFIQCKQINNINFNTADYVHLQVSISDPVCVDLVGMYRLQEYGEDLFIDELDVLLSNIKSRHVIIDGDININLLKQSGTVEYYKIKMGSYGFESAINEPTRVTNISVSLIDHIYIRSTVAITFKSSVVDS